MVRIHGILAQLIRISSLQLSELSMADDSVVHPVWDMNGGVPRESIDSDLDKVRAWVNTGAAADPDW